MSETGIGWESALRLLPALAIGAVGVATVYATGYFAFAGTNWLTLLTPGDLLNLFRLGLPSFAIAAIAQVLIAGRTHWIDPAFDLHDMFNELLAVRPKWRLWLRLVEFLARSALLAGIAFCHFLPDWADPQWAPWLTTASAITLIPIALVGFFLFPPAFARRLWPITQYGILPLYVVFAVAVGDGAKTYSEYKFSIELKGRAVACAAKIFAGDRGVIYRTANHQVVLAPWAEVQSVVAFDAPCAK